ncbi:MAG: hypothetical protein M3512_13510 [Bacteroidota bacterium]|nr:hypothetical protein [Bacteroidota bacterium]
MKNFFLKVVPFLIFGTVAFSCGGVHNEPPAEIIRTSGAGPSSRTATPAKGEQATQISSQQIILDSSGNPVQSEKK